MSATHEQREMQVKELVDIILRASWPDGGRDGFPTRRTAEIIADVLLDAGVRAL